MVCILSNVIGISILPSIDTQNVILQKIIKKAGLKVLDIRLSKWWVVILFF